MPLFKDPATGHLVKNTAGHLVKNCGGCPSTCWGGACGPSQPRNLRIQGMQGPCCNIFNGLWNDLLTPSGTQCRWTGGGDTGDPTFGGFFAQLFCRLDILGEPEWVLILEFLTLNQEIFTCSFGPQIYEGTKPLAGPGGPCGNGAYRMFPDVFNDECTFSPVTAIVENLP